MHLRILLCALAALSSVSASTADEADKVSGPPVFGQWFCVEPSKVFDVVFDDAEARVNNIGLATATSLLVGAPTVTLTASISNRSSKNAAVSIDVFGSSSGKLKFAISAAPSFGFLAPNKTDQVQGWVIRPPEDAASVDQVCINATKVLAK